VAWPFVIVAELQQSIKHLFPPGADSSWQGLFLPSLTLKTYRNLQEELGSCSGGALAGSSDRSPLPAVACTDVEGDGTSSSRALTADASKQTAPSETCHAAAYHAPRTEYQRPYLKIHHSRDYTRIILPARDISETLCFYSPSRGISLLSSSSRVTTHNRSFSSTKPLGSLATGTSSSLRGTHPT